MYVIMQVKSSSQTTISCKKKKKKLEDTKEVIKSHKSKEDSQYNGQNTMDKIQWTNSDPQNTTQKT